MPPAPRDRATRIADTRRRLREDVDCWVASAGDASPWLVPLSFVFTDGNLLMVTSRTGRLVRDLASRPRVRVALGHTRDVVLIDGDVTVTPIGEDAWNTHDEAMRALRDKLDSDPSTWATALLAVTPRRIQAWREENELAGRELMADGTWHDA